MGLKDSPRGACAPQVPRLLQCGVVGLAVTSIWRRDRVRDEFFEGFARAIAAGTMRARVVKIAPPRLTEMKAAERAELYLKFADRGSKVDFDRVPDLTVGEFLAFRTYVPD